MHRKGSRDDQEEGRHMRVFRDVGGKMAGRDNKPLMHSSRILTHVNIPSHPYFHIDDFSYIFHFLCWISVGT